MCEGCVQRKTELSIESKIYWSCTSILRNQNNKGNFNSNSSTKHTQTSSNEKCCGITAGSAQL